MLYYALVTVLIIHMRGLSYLLVYNILLAAAASSTDT